MASRGETPMGEGLGVSPSSPAQAALINIVLVEDHELMAQALGSWIDKQPGLRLAGWAADGPAGLELCLKVKPGLVILDIDLPVFDGLELAARLRTQLPKARLMALTGKRDAYTVWRALQCGLHGFVDKAQPIEKLLAAAHAVIEGKTYYSPVFLKIHAEWLSGPDAFQKILSRREQEILKRIAVGELDDEIGLTLKIAPATVHAHRRNIRYKLELHNDRQLVAYARRWGLDAGLRADALRVPAA